MDLTSPLFTRLLELSPFVATLFGFLYTVWNSMQKKDDALMSNMKEHQLSMLQMQEKSIMAQNNSADANRQLAGAIGDLKDHVSEQINDVKAQLPARNGARRPSIVTESKPASA